jgi:uncharacterized protein YgiB involved in biofilm formation
MEERDRSSSHESTSEPARESSTSIARESSTPSKGLGKSKRSAHLTLVFISAAAAATLAGCGRMENDGNVSRDVYANLEECRADWGNPEDCEEIDEKKSASGTRAFYGPRYGSRTGNYGGYSTTKRPGSRASGTVSSSPSRGGFGSSSSRHGGSGHSASG